MIYKSNAISPWVRAIASRRVDMWGIGDSNQIYQGHGWDYGFHRALRSSFDVYASPLLSPDEGSGSGSGHGEGYTTALSPQNNSMAPAGFFDVCGSFLFGAIYIDNGASGRGRAIIIEPEAWANNSLHTLADGFRHHARIGTFASDAGSYREYARHNTSSPSFYGTIKNTAATVSGGSDGIEWIQFDTGVTNGVQPVMSQLHRNNTNDLVGKMYHLFSRFEATNQPNGVAHTTTEYLGGQSLRNVAVAWQGYTDAEIDELIAATVRLQVGAPMLLVRINEGLNDRNDNNNSVGPSPAVSSTQAGFYDNLKALHDRISARWAAAGFAAADLYWLITPSHPVDTDDSDSSLALYRDASRDFADNHSNVSVFDLASATSYSEMSAEGWYNNVSTDRNHLTSAGYEALAAREIAALVEASTVIKPGRRPGLELGLMPG